MSSTNKKAPPVPAAARAVAQRAIPRPSMPAVPPVFRPTSAPVQAKLVQGVARQKLPTAPPVYVPQRTAQPLQAKVAQGAVHPSALPQHRPPGKGVVQCQFDRPAGGRSQMLWDKQKTRLFGLPDGGSEEWAAVVLLATNIETLTALVDEKLRERAERREMALAAKKQESAERDEKHRAEQKIEADKARVLREKEAALAEERHQLFLRQLKEAEARELAERIARQQPKTRRRLESLARLLESPANVCVALVQSGAKIYAATNKGDLSPISYSGATLKIANIDGSTGVLGERTRARDAHKISNYVAEGGLSAEDIGGITQVGGELSDSIHAEMKILNWLSGLGKVGTVDVYVSKLCCNNCRIAIDQWNDAGNQPQIRTPDGHGNYFVGWTLPPCIPKKSALGKSILAAIRGQDSDTGMDSPDIRGRSRIREGPSQRERSVSPSPLGSKIGSM